MLPVTRLPALAPLKVLCTGSTRRGGHSHRKTLLTVPVRNIEMEANFTVWCVQNLIFLLLHLDRGLFIFFNLLEVFFVVYCSAFVL